VTSEVQSNLSPVNSFFKWVLSLFKKKPKKEVPFWSVENFRSLAILIVSVLALRWSIASPYEVPTASMEPTIKVGDRILANKLAYGIRVPFTDIQLYKWAEVQRGDIIVFKYPVNPEIDYVKRVVALPGDKIQLIDDILYLNGTPQPKTPTPERMEVLDDIFDRAQEKTLYKEQLSGVSHWVIQNTDSYQRLLGGTWPLDGVPFQVPQNSVFVMGDNRDNSSDSRVWKTVPLSYVHGRADLILWSAWTPNRNPSRESNFILDLPEMKFRFYRFFGRLTMQ